VNDFLEWIEANQAFATLLSYIIIALATLAYALLTAAILRETGRLRKIESDPEIVAYLEKEPRYPELVNIIVANVGRGTAHDISFDVEQSPKIGKRQPLSEAKLFNSVKRMVPGQTYKLFYGTTVELLQDTDSSRAWCITARFFGKLGDKHEVVSVIDPTIYYGTYRAGKDYQKETYKALAEISKDFKRLVARVSEPSLPVDTRLPSSTEEDDPDSVNKP
jgi:hypothetical protein